MAFLAALGPAMSMISGVIGAVGAISSANAQASAANYNAAVERQNAKIAQDQAGMQAAMELKKNRQKVAYSTAAALQNGFTISGSTADVIDQLKDQGYMDALLSVYSGGVKATGALNNAQLYKMQAKSAMTAGIIGAGSQLMGGFSDAYKTSLQV